MKIVMEHSYDTGMEHFDDKGSGASWKQAPWSIVMTRAWSIVRTCGMEHCDDKGLEHC